MKRISIDISLEDKDSINYEELERKIYYYLLSKNIELISIQTERKE